MPESAAVLNPAISAVTRYVPVGRDGAVYSPALSVVTRAREARAGVADRHLRAFDDRPAGVDDRADDGARDGLRRDGTRRGGDKSNADQKDGGHPAE